MMFTLPHTSGSLSKVLAVLSFYDMNLSMIQSMPIVGQEWRYQFYVNLLFTDYKRYRQAIDAILPLTKDLEILGEYMEGEQSVQ
jgi:prephenate dehydratase